MAALSFYLCCLVITVTSRPVCDCKAEELTGFHDHFLLNSYAC